MVVPALLLILSVLGLLVGWQEPSAAGNLMFPLSFLASIAALVLLLRAALSRPPRKAAPWVVIDGSNVMHWRNETPSLQPLLKVVGAVEKAGYRPVIWFDANVGYKLSDHYMGEAELSQALSLGRSQIRMAPRGTPADVLLLRHAAELGTGVVSNDRFRDWAADFPSVTEAGVLVRGRWVDGDVRLDWPA
jgi:hypothetical protein